MKQITILSDILLWAASCAKISHIVLGTCLLLGYGQEKQKIEVFKTQFVHVSKEFVHRSCLPQYNKYPKLRTVVKEITDCKN